MYLKIVLKFYKKIFLDVKAEIIALTLQRKLSFLER